MDPVAALVLAVAVDGDFFAVEEAGDEEGTIIFSGQCHGP